MKTTDNLPAKIKHAEPANDNSPPNNALVTFEAVIMLLMLIAMFWFMVKTWNIGV